MISRKEYDYDIAGLVDGQTEIHQEMLRNWKATTQWVEDIALSADRSNEMTAYDTKRLLELYKELERQITMNRRLIFQLQDSGIKGLLRRAWRAARNLHWHSPGIGPRR